MFEELKPVGKTWFTADLHLGHKNILTYEERPWETLEQHDEALLQNWRDTVGEEDVVYVLGDVTLGSVRKYRTRLQELPGKKFLVCGNHDSAWIGFKEGSPKLNSVERYTDAGFSEVNTGIRGQEWVLSYEALGWPGIGQVLLSHFPTEGESNEARDDRYIAHRPQDSGIPILCGHVHGAWKTKGRCVNVGVDIWDHRPVSSEEIWPLVQAMQVQPRWPKQHY